MKNILLSILLLLIVLLTGCQENTGNEILGAKTDRTQVKPEGFNDSPETLTLVQKLDVFAQGISYALKDASIMEALNGKIQKALAERNKEGVLNLKNIMGTIVDGKSIVQRMSEASIVLDKSGRACTFTPELFNNLVSGIQPQVDIYFPVDEQRANWYASKSRLLVAFADPENEWGDITAYNLQGIKSKLSAYKVPQNPVLAISLCEHGGKHSKAVNTIDNLQIDPPPGGGGSGGAELKDFYFEWVMMTKDYEPWINGDPEFKMFFALSENGDEQATYRWGDEYGYWDILGYNQTIYPGDWNHKDYLILSLPANSGGIKWDYGSVKIIEQDTSDPKQNYTLQIPLDDNKNGAKGSWTFQISYWDDNVGENTFIRLNGYPTYWPDQNIQPNKSDAEKIGGSYATFWW